jgi:hypothetical protein
MAKINPNDSKWSDGAPSGDRPKQVGPGRKLLAAVGFERYESRNGNPMVGVRFVCLVDREAAGSDVASGDEQGEIYENFTMTDRAMWRVVDFARAIGYPDAFDPEDDEDLGKLLTHGYVEAIVEMDSWQGRERPKIARFQRPGSYSDDPDWGEWIEAGEERHRGYLSWRADNPRGSGNYSSGSASSRSSGSSGSSSASRPSDDIPF